MKRSENGAEAWRPNDAVLHYIEEWHEYPRGPIVIWSGGGKDYAETWAKRLLPDIPYTAMSKFNAVLGPGDVCVDDSPFDAWKHRSIHPQLLADVTMYS